MRTALSILIAACAISAVPLLALAQTMDFAKVEILTEQLGPNVYMLTGSSGLDPSHRNVDIDRPRIPEQGNSLSRSRRGLGEDWSLTAMPCERHAFLCRAAEVQR